MFPTVHGVVSQGGEGGAPEPITRYEPLVGVELAPEFVTSELAEIGVPYAPDLGVELEPEFIGGTYEPG